MVLKKSKGLFLAFFVIFVAAAMITTGTVALFSNKIVVVSHFQAGELKADLYRTSHQKMLLGEDGYMHKTVVAEEEVQVTSNTTNMFELQEGDLLVPLCEQIAEFRIENHGDVTFVWSLQLMINGEEANESDEELLEQLKLTVELLDSNGDPVLDGDQQPIVLQHFADDLTDAALEVGEVAPQGKGYFRVTLLFADLEDNNSAMNQNAYVDFVIKAVQSTEVIEDND